MVLKFAKVLGILFFIAGIIAILGYLSNANTTNQSALLFNIINAVIYFIVGYGLFRNKMWGVYGVGVMVLVDLYTLLHNNTIGIAPTFFTLGPLGFHAILFFWFYTQKSKFKK